MPPHTLNALVKEYNDGFLLHYLDPRELTRSLSPLSWALRATAPTDHNLSQKVIDTRNNSPTTFSLPKYLNEKHQIAVDASGLEINQQFYNFGSVRIQRSKLLFVFVIGFGLCIGATVLNNMMPINDIPEIPTEVGVTQSNKAPADIDTQNKQSVLDFTNKANESVPKERSTPKKTGLGDFNNHNIADSTKDKAKSSFSSKPTPPAKNTVEDTHTQHHELDSVKKKVDDSTKDEVKPTFSPEPTPPEKKILEETSAQKLKLDSVKKPVVKTENATEKKEETSSCGDTKRKQNRNIFRVVKNIVRSAICALTHKCD